MPWLPVPAADLALLGQDCESWFARKIICGLMGLGVVPALTVLAALAGDRLPWTIPAVASLAFGVAAFFVPDLVTKVKAAERRTDFRHALTSYLDLVALERGAGAGPTDALEAAAHVGGGWTFARIGAALDASRKTGRPPWEGLAALAAQTGVRELADIADMGRWQGRKGRGSCRLSPPGPSPCAPRRWPPPGQGPVPAAPPWSSRSPCSARGSWSC